MPNKPPSPCAHPGCRSLATIGPRCTAHTRLTFKQDRERRGSSYQRGYDGRHKQWRIAVLTRDPICKACHGAMSTDADHIVSLAKGGTWEVSNGQGLCGRCHRVKTAREDGSFGRDVAELQRAIDQPSKSGKPMALWLNGQRING